MVHIHVLRPHPQCTAISLCVGVLHHKDDVLCRWSHTNMHKDVRKYMGWFLQSSLGIFRFCLWFHDFICDFWFHLWFLISTVIPDFNRDFRFQCDFRQRCMRFHSCRTPRSGYISSELCRRACNPASRQNPRVQKNRSSDFFPATQPRP